MGRSLALRLAAASVWAVAVTVAMTLMARGLAAGFFIENTDEALAEARHGAHLVTVACVVLGLLIAVSTSSGWPRWVTAGLAVPIVLCGGLTALAPETLLPQLSIVVALPGAAAAGVGGLVRLVRPGPPPGS